MFLLMANESLGIVDRHRPEVLASSNPFCGFSGLTCARLIIMFVTGDVLLDLSDEDFSHVAFRYFSPALFYDYVQTHFLKVKKEAGPPCKTDLQNPIPN